jgi:phosphoglycerate dehydrogenase-like enzyme
MFPNRAALAAEGTQTRPRLQVAVLDDYQDAARRFGPWEKIKDDIDLQCFHDHLHERAALVERLRPFDIVCLMRERTPMDANLIDALPKLKLIVTTGMFNAALDSAHAVGKGIVVCGTQTLQSGTPELTWLLILALARQLNAEVGSVRAGGWQTAVGMELRNRTIGLVGLGTVGGQIARVAGAFGMRVIAWSQNLTTERAAEAGAMLVDKKTLLQESDFVSIHLRLSERTRAVIGADDLKLMKPTAFLVNTARGPLVDEAALISALQSRQIAGAGLDVYDVEPLPPEHAFGILSNVVAMPHVGYVTDANYHQFFQQTVEDIRAFLEGRPVRQLGGHA